MASRKVGRGGESATITLEVRGNRLDQKRTDSSCQSARGEGKSVKTRMGHIGKRGSVPTNDAGKREIAGVMTLPSPKSRQVNVKAVKKEGLDH